MDTLSDHPFLLDRAVLGDRPLLLDNLLDPRERAPGIGHGPVETLGLAKSARQRLEVIVHRHLDGIDE